MVLAAIVLKEPSDVRIGARPQFRLIQGMAKVTEAPRSSRQEDIDLVARFNKGDTSAFSELFRRHHKDVTRLVTRMLGASRDAQDVVQEVFLQVFKSLPDFLGKSRLSTWVYRIGVNVVLMHRRAARSRPVLAKEDAAPVPTDPRPLPDEQVERSLRVAALDRLMDLLSEKKRTVFVLHELQGLAPVEIAKIVRAPVFTVRTRLFYARRELVMHIGREPSLKLLFPELISAHRLENPAEDLEKVAEELTDARNRGES